MIINTKSSSLLILVLVPLIVLVLTVWFYTNQHEVLPDASKWCIWDCGWYNGMREHGYIYKPNQQNNLAFFPLFPLVWQFLGVGNIGIGLINFFIFVASAWLLIKHYKISFKSVLVFLCVGLVWFFMIPYTESFFFFGAVLIMLGFNKYNYWLIVLGAIVAIGTRSASMIFMVAFLMMMLINFVKDKKSENFKIIGFAMFAVVSVNLLVFYYQYTVTGRFFGFFEAHQYWDHHLRWPKLTHISWHKPIALTENFALLVGVFAIFIIITFFISALFKNTKIKNPLALVFKVNVELTIAEQFALLYLAGGTTFILLYQQDTLSSLNRYILSTPFYLLLLHLLATKKIEFNVNMLFWTGLMILMGFTVSHSHFEHKIWMILAALLTTTTVFWSLSKDTTFYRIVTYLTCILGIIIQAYLFNYFISGNWVA